jgi:asparagine synthase (glutamine-hydrolysing)
MCGIAGVNGPASRAAAQAVERALEALRHRGPDDAGSVVVTAGDSSATEAVLGNRRLAILELSPAGHQPMQDEVTGNWVVFNGELYNHLEVREQLADRTRFRGRSDTETLLRAYREWGESCLPRLRGMFAFALWDARDASLWCARDRLGIKPFYYALRDGLFAFASEARALLAAGLAAPDVDARGLAGYVRWGSVPEPLTLVAGIASLPAGHTLRARAGRVLSLRRYWSLAPGARDERPAAAQVADELRRAVREHLLSDVPVASFLSGGVDSTVVTALAAAASPRPIETFTVCFPDRELDESDPARAAAERHATRHREVRLSDADVVALVPRCVPALDMPSADAVNTWLVSRAVASAGIKVVLSGLGGDELFGGYTAFARLPALQSWAPVLGRLPAFLRARIAGAGDAGARGAEMSMAGASLVERYEASRSFWSKKAVAAMGLDAEVSLGADDPGPGCPLPARLSALELSGYMRSTLLRDSDVTSMAHSLELRVPLLDHLVVERCLALGAAERRGRRPKALLVDAMRELLPAELAQRPKRGFELPFDRWMRGPLRGFVEQGLHALQSSGAVPGLDTGALQLGFDRRELRYTRVWQFVVLGHWLRETRARALAA